MKAYKAYLIDLDGTMYRGKDRIEEASDFVKALQKKKVNYRFVTNNSSQRPEQIVEKLLRFDIPASKEQVMTSSLAAASYISQQQPGASVYFIGEEGLEYALKEAGLTITDKNPDFVVVGIDRSISYEKLAQACLAVRAGAKFYSTNSDIAIPTERGLLPGNGSLTSVIEVSTGVKPKYIGKPESIIMEQALKDVNVAKEEALMVGDNYHTDILAGIRAGVDTLMVFTGVTQKAEMPAFADQPTYKIDSLEEWIKYI